MLPRCTSNDDCKAGLHNHTLDCPKVGPRVGEPIDHPDLAELDDLLGSISRHPSTKRFTQ